MQCICKSNLIKFNTSKTICNKFGEPIRINEQAMLNGVTLTWQEEVRHLGNYFNCQLHDNLDSKHKCWHFIGFVIWLLCYLSVIVVHITDRFSGNIIAVVLHIVEHSGINVLEWYINSNSMHIDGY